MSVVADCKTLGAPAAEPALDLLVDESALPGEIIVPTVVFGRNVIL
jgi:hypothetical protein